MLSMYARRWWVVALQGLAAVLFGVLTLVWPRESLSALVIVFGVFALADGLLALIAGIAARWLPVALAGGAGIVAGILAIVWPNITATALLYLIAAWAIVTGIFEIVAAIELRRLVDGEWVMAFNGILSIVFGVLLVLFPSSGALALAWLIGAYAIISGIALIVLAFRVRGWQQDVDEVVKQTFGDVA